MGYGRASRKSQKGDHGAIAFWRSKKEDSASSSIVLWDQILTVPLEDDFGTATSSGRQLSLVSAYQAIR